MVERGQFETVTQGRTEVMGVHVGLVRVGHGSEPQQRRVGRWSAAIGDLRRGRGHQRRGEHVVHRRVDVVAVLDFGAEMALQVALHLGLVGVEQPKLVEHARDRMCIALLERVHATLAQHRVRVEER